MSGFIVSGGPDDYDNVWYFDTFDEAYEFALKFEDEFFKTGFSIEEVNY